ncbi:LuxR C-terminal-related transcriptional regulator [Alphaproteobacteria bacterium LMG 31809]|uniref:LuxR C-terminal-related transcriptional regulator n=1 Tax=Govanella unica TaxID=2975056 RepID=A0A9X3TY53_9PROT|nr:LuxR C-terminal-related transcriptional regulator [Govania unica]
MRSAWLTLDEEDASPTQFLSYLFAALQTADVNLPEYNPLAERSFQDAPFRSVMASIFKAIEAIDEPVVLIIDDYHRAEGKELNSLFEWLVRFSPPQLHIVVASRDHPQITRENLRVQGELLEFTNADLAFVADDVKRAFEANGGQEIDAAEIVRLTDRTEGWPLAIELALKWSLGEPEKARKISEFSGRTHDLARYLSEQLLSGLPADTQAFLLQTSILPRISGDLASHVTGRADGWLLLEKLEQQNIFLLRTDIEGKWFRYHPLVAEFLVDRLLRLRDHDVKRLHQLAAGWFGDNGYLGEALSHAAQSSDGEMIATLLEQAGGWRLILDGRMSFIQHYLPEPSSPHLADRPRIQLAQAFLLIKCGKIEEASAYLASIRPAFETTGLPINVRLEVQMVSDIISDYEDIPVTEADIDISVQLISALPAHDNILQAIAGESLASKYYYCGFLEKSFDAVSRASRSYEKIGSFYGMTFTLFHKSRVKFAQGKLKEAEKILDDLIDAVHSNFGAASDLAANLAAFRSEYLYEKNDIPAASALLSWALPHMEASDGWFDVYEAGYLTAARCAYRITGLDAALDILERARGTAKHRRLKRLKFAADLCEIELAIEIGDLERAQTLANSIELSNHITRLGQDSLLSRHQDYRMGIVAARLNIALGQSPDHLAGLENLAQSESWGRQLIEIRILRAIASFSAGEQKQAASYFDKAVSSALFEGSVRVLVKEGAALLPLIQYIESSESPLPTDRFRNAFVKEIHRLIKIENRLSQQVTSGILLPKGELETLRILDTGLTNKEIAIKLDVSPSTVKYRLKSLFVKLGVSSRREAVKLARDKGWLHTDILS